MWPVMTVMMKKLKWQNKQFKLEPMNKIIWSATATIYLVMAPQRKCYNGQDHTKSPVTRQNISYSCLSEICYVTIGLNLSNSS